jgi:hypothetical protein
MALTVVATVMIAGCGGFSSGGWGNSCKRTNEVEAAPRVAPEPAHADFEKLRAYRHYFSLARVDDYAHHFAVYYSCIEPSVNYYAVTDDGEVKPTGGYWGGLAVRGKDLPRVPDHVRKQAELARRQLDEDWDGYSNVDVVYLGSFRKVVVNELIPLAPPGSPYSRLVNHGEVTLEANRDLTELAATPASFTGGITRLCWEDTDYRDCTEQYWIDFEVSKASETRVTPAIADDRSPVSGADRERFEVAVLGAVAAQQRGEASVGMDELLARDSDALLPDGFATPIGASFTIYARSSDHAKTQQGSGGFSIYARAEDAVFGGEARGTGSTTIAGVGMTGELVVSAPEPLGRDVVGEHHLPLSVSYVLRDDRGNERASQVTVDAWLFVDNGSVAIVELKAPDEFWQKNHEPPRGQSFPGVGDYTQIDTYLDLTTSAPDWLSP